MSRRYGPFDPFERRGFDIPTNLPPLPRPTRRFWIGASLIGAVILLLFVIGPIVDFWTELLWFRALGLQDVFLTGVAYKLWLFWGGFALALAFALANVYAALRLRLGGGLRAVGIRRRYLRSLPGAAGIGVSLLLALVFAGGASSQWQTVALFLHSQGASVQDPVFSRDVGFYMLTLPFYESLLGWLTGLTFLTLLLVGALYALRGETVDLRFSPPAVAHLSVLGAVLALLLAVQSWLHRYDLLSAHNSVVWGAGFADINARMPMAVLGTILGVLLALLLLANVVLRRAVIGPVALAAWFLLGVVGLAFPAAVQTFYVAPSELSREQPYIQREIEFTRRAFGLDKVAVSPYSGANPLTKQAVDSDRPTIDNLRLWDYRPLADTYSQLQTIRTYYTFHDIDLDRYTLGGRYQQLELSARELESDRLPSQAQTWVNQKLTFTHGYGLAASPVNAVAGEGVPDYVARDLPPQGTLKVDHPAIYFGETQSNYVLAPSAQQEFDYPQGGQDVYTSYTGTHGVPMDGLARALFSFKTRDFNLLISPQIQSRTEILYRRNIVERTHAIAPFLTFDGDPYIVTDGGRLYWIMDAYTTSNRYPYSQEENLSDTRTINYMRNSVKVVLDAYEGTTEFYVADSRDPIIRAYAATFPSLFKPIDRMPPALRAHVRVPEQLFTIQASVYRTYHMSDPRVFYNREDVWALPSEQASPSSAPQQLQPYYVLMRLPGEAKPEYLLILPFTPNNKQNMISWLAARSDAPHYGELVSYQLSKDRVVFGPQQIANRIQENPQISRDFSLLNQSGSQVVQGNLLVVPVGDTFLYFEPIYLRATGAQSLPELKKVILADSRKVVYEDNLGNALDALVGEQTGIQNTGTTPTPSPSPGGTTAPSQLQDLARQAQAHYQAAQDRLKAGDLTGYAQEIQQVGQILQQMNAQGGSPSPGLSPSPSPR